MTKSDVTTTALLRQIAAMESTRLEIGVYQRDARDGGGAMFLRDCDPVTLLRSIPWLRCRNAQGCDVYIRPAGCPHNLSLVDDLTLDAIEMMKQKGFSPALVVETSPRNYQAWLKHPEALDKQTSSAAARTLAEKFGGDEGAADWRHFGRMAGFTNRKPAYQDVVSGLYPFVRLVEASGQIYSEAQRFIAGVKSDLEQQRHRREQLRQQTLATDRGPALKSIETFRRDPKRHGDGNRCDLAYAVYAFGHGADPAHVEAAIRSRDLSHKGSERRQQDYIERTIKKALEGADRSR
jgi:hypothetical protein